MSQTRSALLSTRWGETTARPWSLPGRSWRWRAIPQSEFLFFGNSALIAPLLDARPALKSASRLVAHRDCGAHGGQAEPGAALRPLEILDVARDRRGQEGRSRHGGVGRQYRRADGDVEVRSQNAAGIERPAIAALWPTLRGESIVLDVGASIGADAEHLVDLAVMGAATARILFGLERPTVGLLNIGVEEAKGLEEVREAGRILRERQLPDLDYVGFVEGDDIGKGKVDVVVTEGFAGNIALKTAEGTARQLGEYLRAR
jgi:glycerol-3-phosphate acyltransferase PlsX